MFFESFKQWMGAQAPEAAVRVFTQWARRGGWHTRVVRQADYVGIELIDAPEPLRLEWRAADGSSRYGGAGALGELRLRCDLGLPEALQLLVMDRRLIDHLAEHEAVAASDWFQETRWLAVLPRISRRTGGATDVEAVASHTVAGMQWFNGELADKFRACRQLAGQPFASLEVERGSQKLRVLAPLLDDVLLEWAADVTRRSARQVREAAMLVMDGAGWPTTVSATWIAPSTDVGVFE